MSDSINDLVNLYDQHVKPEYPRSIGLFPIPEYPEFESRRGMWSAALDAILTTLRYLAPATLLTLFWGQQSFLFRLLKSIDSAFRAIVFSSEEQKQEVLEWLAQAGPVRVEHLDTVWRHGWILCGVLDAALPGACAGHPPTRLSLKHAQTIADHYLGVEPVFSRQELESNNALSRHQEWKLATYLDRIRQALAKLTPPVSKPTSQRTSPEITQFTLDYVAKGSGLTAAQVNNKMYFRIYPTSQQSLDPGEITLLIRGPKDTYGMAVVPPVLGKAQLIRQKLLGLQSKQQFTENALPITQGATYLRTYGKNNMNKTYHIPKTKYDIEIDVGIEADHAKIGYLVGLEGKYEISITSRGQNIVGSPFSMTASRNILKILERDSFCLEDGEEIGIVDVKTDRKVVLRIVDFVTEKMLLKENGTLEKITDEEASLLMSTDNLPSEYYEESRTCSVTSTTSDEFNEKNDKFNKVATKIVQMNRVCKIINSLLAEKRAREKAFIRPRSQQSIPDIVNSTFSETNMNPFIMPEKRIIVPENITVSLRTEKSKSYEPELRSTIAGKTALNFETLSPDSLDNFESIPDLNESDLLKEIPNSSYNPFLNDAHEQNFVIEKDLGSFVKTEYETNKSENEETEGAPIQILVENLDSATPSPTNPFIETDIITMERPKTPILKIITGEVKDREDPVYINSSHTNISENLSNEFINPFFTHRHEANHHEQPPVADFIIGAPVSLPPVIRAPTPEPDNMDSILITEEFKTGNEYNTGKTDKSNEEPPTVFSTPVHAVNKFKKHCDPNDAPTSQTFYSLESNTTDSVEIISLSNSSDNQEHYQILLTDGDITPKKDTWDSAYVSIDESNTSPDSNNNDNITTCETPCKEIFSLSDTCYEFEKMGPAEREIWQTCTDLTKTKIYEEMKPKYDIKRPMFTPIIEENDRSMSTGTKELARSETDTGHQSVTFTELKDMYNDFTTNVNNSNLKRNVQLNNELDYTIERDDTSVDSASELSDVKRHAMKLEGKISEVQANVTESITASQTLHKNESLKPEDKIGHDCETCSNIVLQKKQYWDKRIREIEAKSTEENQTQQKRRRLSARHLRQNDSLTKQRGKLMVKNFITASGPSKVNSKYDIKEVEIISRKSPISPTEGQAAVDEKLVVKWKQYWNSKLESEKEEPGTSCFRAKSPKSKEGSISPPHTKSNKDDIIEKYQDNVDSSTSSPVKQELPEEVFKAFETSPKRFFGTSRKQILNKIDTFLGKPSTAEEPSPELSGASNEPDTGLVSSRISLFHTMSNTEKVPWTQRKSQSMHNIFQRRQSERSISVSEDVDEKRGTGNLTPKEVCVRKLENKALINEPNKLKNESEKIVNISLQEKRARMVQNIHNKSFDETVSKKRHQIKWQTTETTNTGVKKTINEYNKQSEPVSKYKFNNSLRKSSMSKSEMDIFTKITNKPVEDDLDKYKSCDELPKINIKKFINLYESVSKTDVKKPVRNLSRTSSLRLQKLSISSSSTGAVNNIGSSHFAAKHQKTSYATDESTTDLTPSSLNRWNKDPETMSNSSIEPRSLDSIDVDISTNDLTKQTTYVSLSDIELEIVENANEPVKTKKSKKVEQSIDNFCEEETKQKDEVVEVRPEIDYKCRFKMAKEYFKSLEELREVKKKETKKLNECEMLLLNKSNESLENVRPQKRTKKNIRAHSVPSSEISKIWTQLQESQNDSKLVKISEKFNVEDLFNDVMEGKLSRQGSLRGIPHKKAVLEAFRSMENLTDSKINSYEITASQLSDFANENHINNAQTYLTEYPYLPTTDPAKYRSRLDTRASGLISLKELHSQKPRRNSVPDLRLNPTFTAQL